MNKITIKLINILKYNIIYKSLNIKSEVFLIIIYRIQLSIKKQEKQE